jgi:hypothetical protein
MGRMLHKVPAHRVILSAWSPVLRDYLEANADKQEVELQLPHQEHSIPVFKQVLRFIYTGCAELSKEIAVPLLVRTLFAGAHCVRECVPHRHALSPTHIPSFTGTCQSAAGANPQG